MQNWCANLVLKAETGIEDAIIISMIKPMHSNPVVIDPYNFVANELFPLFMILVFLMPIYRFTSWIVSDKMNKTKDVARSMGVSEGSY